MEALRSMTRFERRLMLALLGCVLIARMLVPTGWMPVVGRDGHVSLTLCSGMGPVAMKAMPGMAGKAPAQDHNDHPCIGAGVVAGLETAEIATPLPALAPRAAPPALSRFTVSIGRGLAAPPPPPTGPPARV